MLFKKGQRIRILEITNLRLLVNAKISRQKLKKKRYLHRVSPPKHLLVTKRKAVILVKKAG